MTEPVELLFLRYSLPCTHYLQKIGIPLSPPQQAAITAMTYRVSSALRIKAPKEPYQILELMLLNKIPPLRGELQVLYPNAVRRLGELSPKDLWDPRVISAYWREHHTPMIDKESDVNPPFRTPRFNGGKESVNDLCRINTGEIVKISRDHLDVKYQTRSGSRVVRHVSGIIVPGVTIGEKVKLHYWYAVEKA